MSNDNIDFSDDDDDDDNNEHDDNDKNEQLFMKQKEEELMQKYDRRINEQAKKEIENFTHEKENSFLTNNNNNNKSNNNNNDSFLKRKEQELMAKYDKEIRNLEIQEAESDKKSTNTIQKKEISIQLPKELMKISDDDNDNNNNTFEQEFLECFRKNHNIPDDEWEGFAFYVKSNTELPGINRNIIVTIEGCISLIEIITNALHEWINYKVIDYKVQYTKTNGAIIVCSVDPAPFFGVEISQHMLYKQSYGLLIKVINEKTYLAKLLGTCTNNCAIIESIQGQTCTRTRLFTSIRQKQKQDNKNMLIVIRYLPNNDPLVVADEETHRNDAAMDTTNENEETTVLMAESNTLDSSCTDEQPIENPASSMDIEKDNEERVESTTNNQQISKDHSDTKEGTALLNADDEVAANDDQVVEEKGTESATTATTTAKRNAPGFDQYVKFCTKYCQIAILEFDVASINNKYSLGRMWHQHKEKYGKECLDTCTCYLDLPYLTQNVVSDQIRKKNSKWTNPLGLKAGEYPVGFTRYFAEKFIPLLKDEYPDENGTKLLQRLKVMWDLHRSNRSFGLKCKDNCGCTKGWELVFKKGRLLPDDHNDTQDNDQQDMDNIQQDKPQDDTSNTIEGKELSVAAKSNVLDSCSEEIDNQRSMSMDIENEDDSVNSTNSDHLLNDSKIAAGNEKGTGHHDSEMTETSNEKETDEKANEAAMKKKAAYDQYNNFYSKFGEVAALEFKVASIHKQYSLGRMWHQHKKKYGEECSDTCTCYLDLPFLTQTVVADQIEKKNSKWTNPLGLKAGEYPSGFAGNFAAKFLPELKDEYPEESGMKLLQRLIAMWELHRKNRSFGIKCNDNCVCAEGWELVFKNGRLLPDDPTITCDNHNDMDKNQHSKGSIPKKRKAPVENVSLITKSRESISNVEGSPLVERRCVTVPKRTRLIGLTKHEAGKKSNNRQAYEISFDCQKSLGFYCVTSPRNGCKILSVCPSGELNDPRIQAETIIQGTRTQSSELQSLKTHHDLKTRCEQARQQQTPLIISFINTFVTSHSVSKSFSKDWSDDGQWCGKIKAGWDGRVPQPVVNEVKTSPDSFKAAQRERNQVALKEVEAFGNNKKIKFQSHGKYRLFEINKTPAEFLREGDFKLNCGRVDLDQDQSLCQSQVPSPNKVLSLGQNSIQEILDLLHENPFEDQDPLKCEVVFKGMRGEVSRELRKFPKKGIPCKDEAAEKSREELFLKDKLGKIYINSSHVIQLSRSLKHWERFQVIIDKIDDITLSNDLQLPNECLLMARLVQFFETGHQSMDPLLPWKPLSNCVLYSDSPCTYIFNYNSVLPKTCDRYFDVELFRTDERGSSTFLGKIEIPLKKLHEQCHTQTTSVQAAFCCVPNKFLKRATVHIRTKRVPLEPEYHRGKRDEARQRLRTVTEWISRFNDDIDKWNGFYGDSLVSIGANVRAAENISILHAALYLKDIGLVKTLLNLGADPSVRSRYGSAFSVAQNMADGKVSTALVTHKRDDGNNSTAQDSGVAGEGFEGIMALLRDHKYRTENQPCTKLTEDQVRKSSHNRSHSDCSSTQNLPNFSSESNSAMTSDTNKVDLPLLEDPDWLIPDDRKQYTCRFFDAGTCRYANKHATCPYIHSRGLWGQIDFDRLLSEARVARFIDTPIDFRARIRIKRVRVFSREWVTAGYSSINEDQSRAGIWRDQQYAIYAQGGESWISDQNVFWYTNERDAVRAVEMAFIVSNWAEKERLRKLSSRSADHGHYGPS